MASDPDIVKRTNYPDVNMISNEVIKITETNLPDVINTNNVSSETKVVNILEVKNKTEMTHVNDVTKRMGQELSCILCLELYTDPRILPCLHSFCNICLERLFQLKASSRSILRCPVCRIGVNLKSGGVGSLQKNFHLASIVEIFRQIQGEMPVAKVAQSENCNKSERSQSEEPPVLPLPANVVNGHLHQPNSFYIDSDSDNEDDSESDLVTWNEEFQSLNQDFDFLWNGSLNVTPRENHHIRIPVWSPSTDGETSENTPETDSSDSVNLSSRHRTRRRAVLPRSLIRTRRVISSLNMQADPPQHSSRSRSRLVNFFKRHF